MCPKKWYVTFHLFYPSLTKKIPQERTDATRSSPLSYLLQQPPFHSAYHHHPPPSKSSICARFRGWYVVCHHQHHRHLPPPSKSSIRARFRRRRVVCHHLHLRDKAIKYLFAYKLMFIVLQPMGIKNIEPTTRCRIWCTSHRK